MDRHAVDRRAIESQLAALESAWNRHDAGAFAAVFAEDADFVNVFGMPAKGRKAIEEFHAPIFATMFRDSRLSLVETRVRFLGGNVAAVDARWEMTGARDPHGNPWPKRRGLLSFVATQDGGWKFDVAHNMELPASDDMADAQRAVQETRGRSPN
jgi:uncharacterized protein (TIGR02246 family)